MFTAVVKRSTEGVYPAISRSGQRRAILPASLGSSPEEAVPTESKIERNIALGLAAADQQIARRRRLHGLWQIADRADDEPGLASVVRLEAPKRPIVTPGSSFGSRAGVTLRSPIRVTCRGP